MTDPAVRLVAAARSPAAAGPAGGSWPTTEVRAAGGIEGSILDGDLVLVGGGDPTLRSPGVQSGERMSSGTGSDAAYDLVVVGGNAGGLSVAIAAQSGGLGRVRILEPSSAVAFTELIGEHQLDVGFGERVTKIDLVGDELDVTTNKGVYAARACVVAQRTDESGSVWKPPIRRRGLGAGTAGHDPVPVGDRPDHPGGRLPPGRLRRPAHPRPGVRQGRLRLGPHPGDARRRRADRGGGCLRPRLAARAPHRRRGGRHGADRRHRPPRAGHRLPPAGGGSLAAGRGGRGRPGLRRRHRGAPQGALQRHHHLLRADPLRPVGAGSPPRQRRHLPPPRQYASLGLGYWEKRIDDAEDVELDDRWDKLVRRSYSISHRIFDEHGYLAQERDTTELEFYIVLVPPTPEHVPGLTPRLALKRPGDRIYLGPKVAGRYTLAPVTDPRGTVVFFATGTGEAPHNAMIVELLRKGHQGGIVSAVTVRQMADLGYLEKNRELEARYANFHYLPLPTREPGIPKRYIQDLIIEDVFAKEYGVNLDPETTHGFLCGNPAMIGLATEEDGRLTYPKPTGVVEILTERGFTLDHRKQRGNLHSEEYW